MVCRQSSKGNYKTDVLKREENILRVDNLVGIKG